MNLEIADRWLSVVEIAHYLGISIETVFCKIAKNY